MRYFKCTNLVLDAIFLMCFAVLLNVDTWIVLLLTVCCSSFYNAIGFVLDNFKFVVHILYAIYT